MNRHHVRTTEGFIGGLPPVSTPELSNDVLTTHMPCAHTPKLSCYLDFLTTWQFRLVKIPPRCLHSLSKTHRVAKFPTVCLTFQAAARWKQWQ